MGARLPGWTVRMAAAFHEEYERLAPSFGYETRPESRIPWNELPRAHRLLMASTVHNVVGGGNAMLRALAAIRRLVETLAVVAQRAHEAEAALSSSADSGNTPCHTAPFRSLYDTCRHPLCRRANRAMLRAVRALRAAESTDETAQSEDLRVGN